MSPEDRAFLTELTGCRTYWTAIELQGSGKVMCFECAFCGCEQNPQKVGPNLTLPDILNCHTQAHVDQIPPARRAAFMAALGMGVEREEAMVQVLGFPSSQRANFWKSGRKLES